MDGKLNYVASLFGKGIHSLESMIWCRFHEAWLEPEEIINYEGVLQCYAHCYDNDGQRSVTHDFLHYINILTYLLTYLLWWH